MSTTVIASRVNPIVMLNLMASMMKSVQKNLNESGEVKLIGAYAEMEINVGGKTVMTAAYDATENVWSIHGDARLAPAVTRLIAETRTN